MFMRRIEGELEQVHVTLNTTNTGAIFLPVCVSSLSLPTTSKHRSSQIRCISITWKIRMFCINYGRWDGGALKQLG